MYLSMRHAPGKNRPFAKYCTVVIVCRHGKTAILPAVGAFCFTLLQMSVTDVTAKSLFYIYFADLLDGLAMYALMDR